MACSKTKRRSKINGASNEETVSSEEIYLYNPGNPRTNGAAFLKLWDTRRKVYYADKLMDLYHAEAGMAGTLLHDENGEHYYNVNCLGRLTYTDVMNPNPPEIPRHGDRIKRVPEFYGILLAGKINQDDCGDLIDYTPIAGDMAEREGCPLSRYNGVKWIPHPYEDTEASSSSSTITTC